MSVRNEGGRLGAQIKLIKEGLPDAAAYPDDWERQGYVNYLYRDRAVLVRDADVDRVIGGDRPMVQGSPVEGDNNLRGLTLIQFSKRERRSVEQVCTLADQVLGEGMVTPDHIYYICPGTCCPATEPEEVPDGAPPEPAVSTEPCDGDGV